MPLTEKGGQFVRRMAIVETLIRSGLTPFQAMACTLDNDEWDLLYALAKRSAHEILATAAITDALPAPTGNVVPFPNPKEPT